jgi:hypothetical protein
MKRYLSTTPNRARWLSAIVASLSVTAFAQQELIYQEGFNTDGEKANPQRYTFTGRDVFEVPRIQSELNNYDQKGPLYWAHNFDTTFVGNPGIPERRMILTWRAGADISGASADLLKLVDSSVDWLLKGKKNATIVVNPNVASLGGLADHWAGLGHTLVDDDLAGVPDEQDVQGDLFIHGPGAGNPSRFVLSKKPVIVINAPDYDDMLVGSIGSTVTFTPGKATVGVESHPGAGGLKGSFDAFTGPEQFEVTGSYLPEGAIKLATVTRIVPPAVNNLGDVDAMIAGTKVHQKTAGTATELDFSDASAGNWGFDNALPGGYTGNWGINATGKLRVAAAGTYRFALGSDDGARLAIDLDKNGLTDADAVLTDPGPHAHQVVYVNVTFPTSGTYDFGAIGYNSSGGGSLEVSVALASGDVPDDALDSGYWEVLSTAGASPVTLQAAAAVTGFVASGPDVEVQEPLIVLLNGPTDVPPGFFYDGGAFSGFEGTGFIGASGLNKWPYPDGQSYRSIRLKPVNVAGKPKVRVTVALAATVVDFETSDFIETWAYPNGANSTPVRLSNFRGVQNAIQPWLADENEKFVRRLTKQFADFTFDVPAGATDLVLEFRAATTWWTEIAALDNVRITSGDPVAAKPISDVKATASGENLVITFKDGTKPFILRGKATLDGPWVELLTTDQNTISVPLGLATGFFQVGEQAKNTVKLFKASLTGAAEIPAVTTPAAGFGLLGLDAANKKAHYLVSYSGLKANLTAAHLHGPAEETASAGVLFAITAIAGSNQTGGFAGTVDIDDAKVTAINDRKAYFNVHSTAHPGGEIRGQLKNP